MSLGIPVQPIWSQRLYDCIAQDPALPICDGNTHPCNNACTAADDGNACAGATPVCDTTAGSTHFGTCVACNANADCKTASQPICNATTNTCGGCSSDTECSGSTPKCNAASGACVGCVKSSDCSGATAVCDSPTGTCVGCETNADCTNRDTPTCNGSSHTCVSVDSGPSGGAKPGAPDAGSPRRGADGGAAVGNGDTASGGDSSSGCSTTISGPAGDATGLAGFALALGALARRRARR